MADVNDDRTPPVTIRGQQCVTPRQAAAIKGCSLRTIRYWMAKGRLPVYHEGKGTTARARIPINSLRKVHRFRKRRLNEFDLPRCPGCRSFNRGPYERDGEAVAICLDCGRETLCPKDHYLTKLLEEMHETHS